MSNSERIQIQRKPDDDPAARLVEIVKSLGAELDIYPKVLKRTTLDTSFDRDLGLDSLSRMELLTRVEHSFGVMISEHNLGRIETLRDLLREILSADTSGYDLITDVSTSELDEVENFPHQARTLIEVLDWHVKAHPNRPHIQFFEDEREGEVITFAGLNAEAKKVAAGLQHQGLTPGETVAIMLPTGSEYFYSFIGILLAGGIPVALYPPSRPSQIEDHLSRHQGILLNCEASILITFDEAKKVARLLKFQTTSLKHIVTPEDLKAPGETYTKHEVSSQNIAFLQYTSGSTGTPKGVILTHQNLLENVRAMGTAVDADATDVVVSWLPLYHDMGLIGTWFSSLYYSTLLVVISPLSFLSRPQRWFWAIHRYKGTLSAAPNFAYSLCLKRIHDEDIKGLDLSSWRVAFNGAEAVSPIVIEEFIRRFGPYGFRREAMMPVYGLAEASVGLAFPPLYRGPRIDHIKREEFMRSGSAFPTSEGDPDSMRFVASGRPLINHEIRIVDGAGHELPERQQGRLQFRGPSATSGYYRNPDATKQLFNGNWLDSGDLAYAYDQDVYITGRIKDVIIHAGRNIYPEELEEIVGNLPGIRKGCVAIFGSPNPKTGTEQLVIVAESREKNDDKRELLNKSINQVSIDLIGAPPDCIVLAPVGSVLKTSSGKVRRSGTRDNYEHGLIGQRSKPVWQQLVTLLLAPVVPVVRDIVSKILGIAYNFWGWMMVGIGLLLAFPVLIIPREQLRWRVASGVLRRLFALAGTRLNVDGLENLLPADQPCIAVSNHASYLDPFVLIAVLPNEFCMVAKAELRESLLPRLVMSRFPVQYIERFDAQKGLADARRVSGVAAEGNSVLFFPEGTITRVAGLLPFHLGAFSAAAENQLPVIPIAISGTRTMLRSGSWFFRPGSINVKISAPVATERPTTSVDDDQWKLALSLRDAAREIILRNCGEADLAHVRLPV